MTLGEVTTGLHGLVERLCVATGDPVEYEAQAWVLERRLERALDASPGRTIARAILAIPADAPDAAQRMRELAKAAVGEE